MGTRVHLMNKAIRVLDSCTSKEQLPAAKRYYEQAVKAMRLEEADAFRLLRKFDDYYWVCYRMCDR